MKIFVGKVVGIKPKTASIVVERSVTHPVYKKKMKKEKKYQVHDEIGVKVGEIVQFKGSKPYSKTKKWKIIKEKNK